MLNITNKEPKFKHEIKIQEFVTMIMEKNILIEGGVMFPMNQLV